MADINLLPWRELRREHDKKSFTIYFVVAISAVVFVLFLINSYAHYLVEEQTNRNQILQDEVTRFQSQIKSIKDIQKTRDALIARMTVVRNLLATRGLTIHLLDELVKILPDGVYLTKLERNADNVTIYGFVESNTNISQLMRNIEQSQWIHNPTLAEIKKTVDGKPTKENEFKLNFQINTKGDGS